MQFFIQFYLDYTELWNVWKQEEYHQHERGFLCWGGPIQVRQFPNTTIGQRPADFSDKFLQ